MTERSVSQANALIAYDPKSSSKKIVSGQAVRSSMSI